MIRPSFGYVASGISNVDTPGSLIVRPSIAGHAPAKGIEFSLLPLIWKQQYTTNHPLSLNSMFI